MTIWDAKAGQGSVVKMELLIELGDRSRSISWYWPTAELAAQWAIDRFPLAWQISVAWMSSKGLCIQSWSPSKSLHHHKGEIPDAYGTRWECMELDDEKSISNPEPLCGTM